jgi:drug/metabolite transporter (DMT)-like permease
MAWNQSLSQPGILPALGAAVLFGAGTPLAKWLLTNISPWLLAGLLYLGSGIGLALYRRIRRMPTVHLQPKEWLWLVGTILAGGVLGPVLLMFGLTGMPASGASLLLNAEGVFTALLAWFAFRENFDRRIALGMAAIIAGAVILSWPNQLAFSALWPALAVLGACLAWGIDNNLTRKISLADASWLASIKGLCAGLVNLTIAVSLGARWPTLQTLAGALLVGYLAYGVSLALFVVGLRHLGTARTGAYFSIAPFFGASLAILCLAEPVSLALLIASALMGLGVWLHLTEHHSHEHTHETLEHQHEHTHDEHHQHEHDEALPLSIRHSHRHRHKSLKHTHAHFPDAHHRHGH